MKKISIVFLLVLNISCSSLMNYQEQPVQLIDQKNNIYKTTCSGMAESIGTCHQKAKRTCERGYQVLNEKLDSSGVHREIKFQCK
ncbi:hypothetical protein FIT92_05990 [Candidatus Methylopumilus universalis]|uniref:Lipoprotein n=2 Tax=Candidatus Methylopumilus universalis TaxID=2588536 RepID=A0AAX1F157_9PROT|nr:hypothetical protein [Candidatus Methylopumilus universalis]QDC41585.1 hypothetical protein FIT94_05990 [Candidatus Methylopumilus universalis]QDC42866.1 hypothetical protein FIT95_05960 [Candidatus Methylopumilus universalis]QDC56534.1 hypothetical protein FIT98_05960 [Candidatus Methylopumilus universalis]QDC57825.1 hypothetical protein FIT96_05990 [Candidatus Methylopumilus universalis]QDC59114.1 hypothetical protein FIT92_05990 [Candidatus Methylopumilus universalis]